MRPVVAVAGSRRTANRPERPATVRSRLIRAFRRVGFLRKLGPARAVLMLAAGVAAILTLVIMVSAALGAWALAATAGALLLSACFVVQVDCWLRLHAPRQLLTEKQRTPTGSGSAGLGSEGDSTAAVRMMQAQYTGRLDRMQTSLEQALAELHRPERATHPDEESLGD